MNRLKKISLIGICILSLTILLPIIGLYYPQSGLSLPLPNWQMFFLTNSYLSSYLFWVSFVAMMLILVFIIIILVYPKNYLDIELSDSKGKLSLKSSAIEGLVQSLVSETGYMKDIHVKSQLSKNNCRLTVEGKLLPTRDTVETSRRIKNQIEEELNAFLGLSHGVNFQVKVKELQKRNSSSKAKTRVR